LAESPTVSHKRENREAAPRRSPRVAVAERLERHGKVERLHTARVFAGKPVYWTSVYLADGVLVDSGEAPLRVSSRLVR
jgi:hypothetical protein